MTDSTHWIKQLLKRYTRVSASGAINDTVTLHSLNTLRLADAVLEKLALNRQHPDHPRQVVVIGPTQSGKSTLVNIMLDCSAAGISALAGFTVHAQGYATELDESELLQLEPMMAPLVRTAAAELSSSELDAYVLETTHAGPHALVSKTVVWDTPDFDSIDAGSYKRSVLKAIAIADTIVLMVSKDKYGDKSVWDILELMHPLAKPLIVCINKVDSQDESTILDAFSSRYTKLFSRLLPPVILLPFVRRTDPDSPVSLPEARLNELSTALQGIQAGVERQTGQRAANDFINCYREQWLTPLIDEQQAADEWQALVQKSVSAGQEHYARDYLNNPEKYDTFNRALAELLNLLEIPGLAPALIRTRQLVTWPARKLLGLGRSAMSSQQQRSAKPSGNRKGLDQEAQTLQDVLDSTLVSLQGSLLEQPQNAYWKSMNQAFRNRQQSIRDEFSEQSALASAEFQPQIDAAARQLYEQLQAQPALLNSLRAARVTADAAGVALAVKTGGIAAADLILAPAMLSVTTLMTESALGRYLDTVKAELRQQQAAHIHSRVLQGVLAKRLQGLSHELDDEALFAQQLEPELLEELDTRY